MSLETTEDLSRRLFECGLVENSDLTMVRTELGSRSSSLDAFKSELLRRDLVTNWQLRRVEEGFKTGFFFGDWKVLYLVGAGTFARVYRAVNRSTGLVRAVKVLRQRYVDDKTTTEQFVREGTTVARLQHENIIRIYEVESDRDRTFMVMDLIEGQNLRDYVKAHQKLDLDRCLSVTRDLAAGLDYAYKRGITHRDLKLSNVLLSSSGTAILVDFGLAGGDKEVTGESEDMVNPRSIDYAALERVTKVRRNDKRSDVYFLGCMFYHMLTGRPALAETRERMKRLSAQRFKEVVPVTNLLPGLPGRVVVLLNKMMELDPNKRLQTPGEALAVITSTIQAIESGDTEAYDPALAEKAAREFDKATHKEDEGNGRTIMLIESKQKLQDLFRDKLKEVGYKVLILSDPRRALSRFEYMDPAEPAPADIVLFSCAELGADGLGAFNFFAENEDTANIPAMLLITDRQQHFLDQANFSPVRDYVELPVKVKLLRKKMLKLFAASQPATS